MKSMTIMDGMETLLFKQYEALLAEKDERIKFLTNQLNLLSEISDNKIDVEFEKAVRLGDFNVVKELTTKYVLVSEADTALMSSCIHRHNEIFKYLHEHFQQHTSIDDDKLLIEAIMNNNLEIIKYLVEGNYVVFESRSINWIKDSTSTETKSYLKSKFYDICKAMCDVGNDKLIIDLIHNL